ncbi:MAG: hypothetical protein WCY77_10205 [Weeksellaceae bacterium]
MSAKKHFQNILQDVKVELTDEFDRNFERKSFFDKAWPKTKLINQRGSMMARTNNLRRSMQSRIESGGIVFSSSLPYAEIQNEGGEITVTPKMKRFFWAMFYQTSGKVKGKKGQASVNLTIEAQQWRNLALMKVGQKVKITQRKFIGEHPRVRAVIEDVVKENLEKMKEEMIQNLNRR